MKRLLNFLFDFLIVLFIVYCAEGCITSGQSIPLSYYNEIGTATFHSSLFLIIMLFVAAEHVEQIN